MSSNPSLGPGATWASSSSTSRSSTAPPPTGKVGTVSNEGLGWGEVDFLTDIEAATKLTDGWV